MRAANAVSSCLGYYVRLFLQTSYLLPRYGIVLHVTIIVPQGLPIYALAHLWTPQRCWLGLGLSGSPYRSLLSRCEA